MKNLIRYWGWSHMEHGGFWLTWLRRILATMQRWTWKLKNQGLVEKRVLGSPSRVWSRRESTKISVSHVFSPIALLLAPNWACPKQMQWLLFQICFFFLFTSCINDPNVLVEPNLFLYFISHINYLLSPRDSISMRVLKFILSSLCPPLFSYFRPSDSFLGLCNSHPKLPPNQSPWLQFLLLQFISQW